MFVKKKPIVVCCLIFTTLLTCETYAEEAALSEQPTAAGSAKKPDGSATKKVKPQILKLANGKLLLPVPGAWKAVKPRSQIIQYEFSIAAAKADETAGRMTVMSASGGVEANIARWVGQFQAPGGKPLGDDAKKVEKKKVGPKDANQVEVHVVDLTGDFQDSPRGPFGPKVSRPGYRMLAAIIPLSEIPGAKGGGTWFIKTYGPQATMKAAEKGFAAMVEGVRYVP